MWRCDPPTRLVVAVLAGLVAAAFGHPLVSLLAAIPWRPRALLLGLAMATALWGGMRVAALQHRALVPGPIDGVVVVTGAPSGDRALVAGVTLGETGSLPADVRAEFRTSGLYHLVAVSGQNVALVVIFALACLALLGVIGAPARVVAAGITIVYVLVTGAGPSIV